MTKRTFVLFFSLAQALALSLFTPQASASHDPNIGVRQVFQSQTYPSEIQCEEDLCEDECLENVPIIQAHETEWKENLSDLLRLRHSNYRFTTFESVPSVILHFAIRVRFFCQKVQTIVSLNSVAILPDYYSFLHRLCPF